MNSNGLFSILIAIETDATRYHGENASRPQLLSSSDAEQMLAHIAADLSALMPEAGGCTLVSVGALFDQTQILRPSYPVFEGLQSLLQSGIDNHQAQDSQARLISLGTEDGTIPADGLEPERAIPLGLLQLLPVLIAGSEDVIAELGTEMEHRFIEEGQLSAHSANWMETAFGISINHGRFMTLNDLNAMFHLQLEHFGFLSLWELIDAALINDQNTRTVTTDLGHVFQWTGNKVKITFESFNYWSQIGKGRKIDASQQQLAAAYADWTRELRRYVTTLDAHSVPLAFELPDLSSSSVPESFKLQETYCVERLDRPGGASLANITEHSFGDLGTVAVTLVTDEAMSHFYPLTAEGLNHIHRDIRTHADARPLVSFPGSILYDQKTRGLRPDNQ
jgi:hypothetical protein